jgi:hypothetical protein
MFGRSPYGPEAVEVPAGFHEAAEEAVWRMWPDEAGVPAHSAPNRKQVM